MKPFCMGAPTPLHELVLLHIVTPGTHTHSCRAGSLGLVLEGLYIALQLTHLSTVLPSTCGPLLKRYGALCVWP